MRFPEIQTLRSVDLVIPVELSRLRDVVYNLWWTWSPRAHLLFHAIHPARWHHYHNPVEVLHHVSPSRWERLRLDRDFMSSYRTLIEEYDGYVSGADGSWFGRAHRDYEGGPVAYFSTEFGWHECLGIYSGGLGILSGDTCKSASDLGIPFVGVGLLYRRGYFRQTIDAEGQQQHFYPDYDLHRLPLLPVAARDGKPLRVGVEFPGRQLSIGVWKATIGRVSVLLLDTDVAENDPADRTVTSFLYVRGREMRLCQEVVLGVGGVRVLEALGISPSVWHMNEGHSAFLALERIRGQMVRDRISFAEALRRTAGNAVFTTHTPVPAGNEVFEVGVIREYFAESARSCGVLVEDLVSLGRARPEEATDFNLTALAIRTSSRANGVSELHGGVADALWRHLRPPGAQGGRFIGHVTNGVHVPTWIGPEMGELLRRRLDRPLEEMLLDASFGDAIQSIPDEEVWGVHRAQKNRLITFARARAQDQFARHGRSPQELRQVQQLLDPDALTLGWARRFATYKRAALLFSDPERLRAILGDRDRPVQILLAGKAHPADQDGRDLIRSLFQASVSPGFSGRILFLENYDMRIARYLVQGVDVWLNTPRRPHEASGTSGMKVAVNGGLNFSILDGWWCEGYDAAHGWVIGKNQDYADAQLQDREDSEAFHSVLTQEIVPCFYRRSANGLPEEWIGRMKKAMALLAPRFSASRMMQEYFEKLYLPASRREGWGSEMDEVNDWAP